MKIGHQVEIDGILRTIQNCYGMLQKWWCAVFAVVAYNKHMEGLDLCIGLLVLFSLFEIFCIAA